MIQSAAMIPSSDGAARVPWHVTRRGSCRWRGHDDGCQEPGDTHQGRRQQEEPLCLFVEGP